MKTKPIDYKHCYIAGTIGDEEGRGRLRGKKGSKGGEEWRERRREWGRVVEERSRKSGEGYQGERRKRKGREGQEGRRVKGKRERGGGGKKREGEGRREKGRKDGEIGLEEKKYKLMSDSNSLQTNTSYLQSIAIIVLQVS